MCYLVCGTFFTESIMIAKYSLMYILPVCIYLVSFSTLCDVYRVRPSLYVRVVNVISLSDSKEWFCISRSILPSIYFSICVSECK